MISDLYEVATGSALASHTARSWLTGWIEEKKVSISPRSRLKYSQIVREFLAHLSTFQTLKLFLQLLAAP